MMRMVHAMSRLQRIAIVSCILCGRCVGKEAASEEAIVRPTRAEKMQWDNGKLRARRGVRYWCHGSPVLPEFVLKEVIWSRAMNYDTSSG